MQTATEAIAQRIAFHLYAHMTGISVCDETGQKTLTGVIRDRDGWLVAMVGVPDASDEGFGTGVEVQAADYDALRSKLAQQIACSELAPMVAPDYFERLPAPSFD